VIATSQNSLESVQDAAWNLEDFVAEVNTRLALMPGVYSDARQREDFSVRLLRHYASLGLVDESERVGREARYRYRHLLQILCLRQLQRQGWNSKAIADFTARENSELESFLNAQNSDSSSPAESDFSSKELSRAIAPNQNRVAISRKRDVKESALEFLESLKTEQNAPKQQMPTPAPQFLLHDPPRTSERWNRIEIAPGLELHVSERYRQARNTTDKRRLLENVQLALEQTPDNQ
jgi:DNA-binding transcriptional MerR regulator